MGGSEARVLRRESTAAQELGWPQKEHRWPSRVRRKDRLSPRRTSVGTGKAGFGDLGVREENRQDSRIWEDPGTWGAKS